MVNVKNILYTIILCLQSTNLFADATQGELFGLKLGERHPVNQNLFLSPKDFTDIFYSSNTWEVPIEDVVKPKNYGDVTINITKISHTIVRIKSRTCFNNLDKMQSFIETQRIVFTNLYAKDGAYIKHGFGKRLVSFRNNSIKFELCFFDKELEHRKNRYCADILIRPTINSQLNTLIKKEVDQILIESQSTEGL